MNAPTLSSQSPEQTYSDQWPTSNAELLNAIFTALPEPLRVKVLGFPGNPKAHKGWGGHPWHPGSDVATERPDWNWYYTLAVYQPTPEGKYSRTAAQCRAIYGVMLDDLGTKAAPLSRLATCPPSLVIETSDNNYQAAYLFDVPQTDVKLIDDLNQAMVNAGLCDSEAKSPATRWGRLPFARNGKTDPSPPCKLVAWNPERRYSVDEIVRGLALEMPHAVVAPEPQQAARPAPSLVPVHGETTLLEDLRAALRYLDCDPYHEWISAGQALCQLGQDGFDLWDEWSRSSQKYDPTETRKKWHSFKGERTGYPAIFEKAQSAGWVNPKSAAAADAYYQAWLVANPAILANLANADPGAAAEKASPEARLMANPANLATAPAVAGSAPWPTLQPLPDGENDDLPPPEPFPFQALGPILGAAAAAIAEDVQAPDSMAGAGVLAAASLVVQRLADVLLPHGQVVPTSLYFVTSAASGDRKSGVDRVVSHAIENHRKEHARRYAREKAAWEQDCASLKKGDPLPPAPNLDLLLVANATVEGISAKLKTQSSIGVFSADGGDVLGGHSMKEANRAAGVAFYLKGWGAEPIDTLRGGAGFTSLLGRRIAMSLMVQPVLLEQLLDDPLAKGQGLLARCLIAQPATLAGTRVYRRIDPLAHPAVQAYTARTFELLNRPTNAHEHGDGFELDLRAIGFSDDAFALWEAFCNAVEAQQAPQTGEYEFARAFASKAGEQAARIAGVITLFNDCNAFQVEAQEMAGAIEIMSFYLSEHLRLTKSGKAEMKSSNLKALLEYMRTEAPQVKQSDILKFAPRAVRKLKVKGIRALLEELQRRGYVRPVGTSWQVRHGV